MSSSFTGCTAAPTWLRSRQGSRKRSYCAQRKVPKQAPAKLLSGPGKLCAALGINVAHSGLDLLADGEVRLFQSCGEDAHFGISRRIGVDYAGRCGRMALALL